MALKAIEYTVSRLSVELRMDKRKVGKLLEGLEPHRTRGKAKYFWLREVVDHIRDAGKQRVTAIDSQTKLNEARRVKLELETGILEGELIRIDEAEDFLTDYIVNCKNRLRSIPHKTAHRIMAASEISDGLKILEDAIREALVELADGTTITNAASRGRKSRVGAAASPHGKAKTNARGGKSGVESTA